MYTGLDAVGVDQQPIENHNQWNLLYFISFLLLVAFFVLNMFVGVVVENFHRCREEQEKEERARRAEKRQRKLERRRRSTVNFDTFIRFISENFHKYDNDSIHEHDSESEPNRCMKHESHSSLPVIQLMHETNRLTNQLENQLNVQSMSQLSGNEQEEVKIGLLLHEPLPVFESPLVIEPLPVLEPLLVTDNYCLHVNDWKRRKEKG